MTVLHVHDGVYSTSNPEDRARSADEVIAAYTYGGRGCGRGLA